MAQVISTLDPAAVRAALARVREQIAAAGRDPRQVEILAAVKYLPAELLPALHEGGVRLVGENTAQQLEAKQDAHPNLFTWDFIGNLQSRKVRRIVPRVRYIHSVCTDSVLAQLERHARPSTRVLVEVNVAGEPGKGGVPPAQLEQFVARCPVPVVGLMTMPPQTENPERSRPYFAALRELAAALGLKQLSMGTSQDYRVALEEGATILRLGTILYHPAPGR
jgi:uncharacterized pyridoxal phosphate-containing UPF0001 family protein